MGKRNLGKRFRRFLKSAAAITLAACLLPVPVQAAGGTSSDNGDGTFTNPVIYSDVPDLDVIRVEDSYYMVSTTMHLSPGMPIMKSKDLVNWEIVNYCYDILDDRDELSLRNGKEAYGNGTWAASIKYHDGKFYVAAASQTTGKTYVFTTTDIENGVWKRSELDGYNHDLALLFDDQDDGTHIYMFTGSGSLHVRELQEDEEGNITYKEDGLDQTIIENANYGDNVNLAAEGAHAYKINGKYYIFMIQWPNSGKRQEICWRSDSLTEGWECKLMLDTGIEVDGQMDGAGVAQGGIVDTPDGEWYAPLFQDHGAVGRVPMLAKVTWENDWPVFSIDSTMDMPVNGQDAKSIVVSDEFYNGEKKAPYLNSESETEANAEAKAAAVLSAQTAVATAPQVKETAEELIVNGGFENGMDGWELRTFNKPAKMEVTSDDKASGESSLFVYDKEDTTSGPMQNLTGKVQQGQKLHISAKVKYETGPDTRAFNITMQYGTNNFAGTDPAASATLKKGEWGTIEADYTVPADADLSRVLVFIETTWTSAQDPENDLMDFYIDDVSIQAEKVDEPETDANDLIVNGGFEDGMDSWEVRSYNGAVNLDVTQDEAASGKSSLFVSGREDTTSGPMQNLTGKVQAGRTYEISAKVKYLTGPDTREFNITFQYGTDKWSGTSIGKGAVITKGEWGTIEGTYTVPADADLSQVTVFIETTWTSAQDPEKDRMDYYVDDVSVVAQEYVDPDEIILNGGFEKGTDNWEMQEPGTLLAVTEDKASGNMAAKVTDREDTASGPMQDLTGKIAQGQQVRVSAKVKYTEGPDSKGFNICIQNGDWTGIDVAASANVKKGEWTTIEGTYTIPNDADMSSSGIFIETAWSANPDPKNDLFDFYVDDISLKKLDNPETAQNGENDYNGSNLKLEWQWNHNPNNNCWSLTERDGYLRLTTANKATGLLDARNTLTQRTYGPTCSGDIAIETANMKNGDVAGLAALQANYGYVGVKMENGKKSIVMVNADGGEAKEIESIPIDQNRVYLRTDFNFYQHADDADFYYSLDGTTWNKIGNTLNMSYTIPHFMGYRFAIFNYATQSAGGYVDVDYFHVNDGADAEQTVLNVNMEDVEGVQGIVNTELEVPLYIDGLPAGTADNMEVSINIPSILDVADVVFNEENVSGTASWTFANHQLKLSVTGEDTGYADNSGDRLFAALKLKVNNYVAADTTAVLRVDYVTAEGSGAAFNVSGAAADVSLIKPENNAVAKLLGNSNPLIDYDYGADPFALVYDGRVYLYMTADQYEYDDEGNLIDNTYSKINKLHVISSDDMVNWTDHGFIQVAGPDGVAKWATYSWAPAIAYKQIDGVDKFFLYFCNSGGGIGVLEGESPVGPWTDPNGKALIDGSTPGVQGVPWIFDPAVMVDDDGTGYLAFGGGVPTGQELNPKSARIVKLADNMTSLADDEDGTPKMIDAPCMFEDGGIHKANGKYYYSYCSNFSGDHSSIEGYPGYGIICYMVSDDPMGPYTYGGEILQNPSYYFNVGGNNHHALFEFNGTTYITYHAQTLGKALGIEKGYRSTHINEVEYYENGAIKPIQADMEGVSQLKAFSPYSEVAGTTIGWNSGIAPKDLGGNNMVLSSVNNGDWLAIGGVDFGENGADSFEAQIAGLAGGTIELRLDSPDGELIGTLDVESGKEGEFTSLSCPVENAAGEHTLFFVYSGDGDDELMEIQSWQFTEKEPEKDVDKTALKEAIDKAGEINSSEYTAASLEKLYEALEAAKSVYEDEDAEQAAVDTAAENLNNAYDALVHVSDKSELQILIAQANELEESDYTKETWKALQEALEAAVAVDAEHDASQDDVDNAAEALKTAIEALEKAPGEEPGEEADKTALKEAIDKASAVDSTKYTTASLEKMYEALDAAKALYEDENAEQAAVDDAEAALNAAYEALVPVADKTNLQDLIARADDLNEADYTKETWNALQTALDTANAMNDNHDAPQDDVDSAAEALKAAMEALEKASGEEPGPGEDPDKPGTTPGEDPDKPGTDSGNQDKTDGDSAGTDSDKAVQTGDYARPGVWVTLMLAGAGTAAVVYSRKRKHRKA